MSDDEIDNMPMEKVLKALQEHTAKAMLKWIVAGKIHPRDIAGINQMLRQNDIKEEKEVEDSMHDKVMKALDD